MVQRLTDPPQATSRFTVFSMFHPVLDSREIAPADRSPLASADGRRDGEFRRRATTRRRARARANIVASAKRSTISDGRVAENGEHLLSLRDRPAACCSRRR